MGDTLAFSKEPVLVTSMSESEGQAALGPCSPDCLPELKAFHFPSPMVGPGAGWAGFQEGQWV